MSDDSKSEEKVRHPAKFTPAVLQIIESALTGFDLVLDPFAGTGSIHRIERHRTVGVEIEPEWASVHVATVRGNALHLPFAPQTFDAVATSPTYGNRMADHHEAKDGSLRTTYRHFLGRPLDADNSGQLQWGTRYREFHLKAWSEAVKVLRPGGRFILNCSDHIRKGEQQHVVAWHIDQLVRLGLVVVECIPVMTPRNRFGANGRVRVEFEEVVVFQLGTI